MSAAPVPQSTTPPATRAAVAAVLALAVFATFWPVLGNDFVGYDDARYVSDNRHVQQGLSGASLRWAWTAFHAANWHPLTWISHMLDWQLWGGRPAGHHLTNLLLHLANALALFALLERATGAWRRSAAVALLFALHPLHVESVAWVAERKDLLSTLLWLATIGAWLRYARAPGAGRYAVVAATFALGLCAKPMLVTAPLTLLLLDDWPLGRIPAHGPERLRRAARLLGEKLPLLALSAASSAVTLAAQARALGSLEGYPLSGRVANALVSYVAYLGKTVWPTRLAVHYPYPDGGPSAVAATLAGLFLLTVTLAALRCGRRCPYLPVGWFWYLGTLVPVIGLVQVGRQAMADRYTYVPLVGIFVIVAWGVPDALRALAAAGRPWSRLAAALRRPVLSGTLAAAVLVALAATSHAQAARWRDARTLFEHALAVTAENAVTHNVLGYALAEEGRVEEAIAHYERAIALNPNAAEAHNNLGGAWARLGRDDLALECYREAVRADPRFAEARNNLGVALARAGRGAEAMAELTEALRIRPDYGTAHANLAVALYSLGRYDDAWREVALAREHGFEPPAAFVERLGRARE